ncbi:MAG TPA: orotidine-5'-phosphate decarboxylase [Candidatus Nanopelagicales bacterium]|nr:orotidine-5'-phosphate decarboxylase [Candidatus Nanopelagicales bacterium]
MTKTGVAPIAVALDAPDDATLRTWAKAVAPYARCLKIGLEVFCRQGPGAVVQAREEAAIAGRADMEMFVDVKLHDIPATVGKAARALATLEPTYVTVHAAGGPQMVSAAVEQLPQSKVAAVTVLTSMDADQLSALGVAGSPLDVVLRWAQSAVQAGAQAIVCSPQEVAALRAHVPRDITLITPGVRPAGAQLDDQRRTATPSQALSDGADLLVIGRPITAASDPREAARDIATDLDTLAVTRDGVEEKP